MNTAPSAIAPAWWLIPAIVVGISALTGALLTGCNNPLGTETTTTVLPPNPTNEPVNQVTLITITAGRDVFYVVDDGRITYRVDNSVAEALIDSGIPIETNTPSSEP